MKSQKVNILLLFIAVVTGFALVVSQYQARKTFVALEKAKAEKQKLTQEWQRINTQARLKASDVPVIAKSQLQMNPVRTGVTQYVPMPKSVLEAEKADATWVTQVEDPLETGQTTLGVSPSAREAKPTQLPSLSRRGI